jgi:hypothetical protein
MSELADGAPLELRGLDGGNPLGFLAALGTLAVIRTAGHPHARLGWQRPVTWVPLLSRLATSDKAALSRSLADALRGRTVSEDADHRRTAMQRDFENSKKTVNDKRKEIRRRGLRGKDRKDVLDAELWPLEEDLRQKRQTWLESLRMAVASPELAIGKHIDCTGEEFRAHAHDFCSVASHAARDTVDLLAAFGTDACLQKSGRIASTPFCFITGSGHQYFLETAGQLMAAAIPERVQAALFEPWTYSDEKLSMRWDPFEDRRYALMDRDPTASDNKSRTVWMANLLAYRALVLFPSVPSRKGLATTAWTFGSNPVFTWPIWERSIDVETIRSLLQLSALTEPNPDRSELRARGIVEVFRSRRIQVGNPPLHKINFSPAVAV